jgi:hypothetical protein
MWKQRFEKELSRISKNKEHSMSSIAELEQLEHKHSVTFHFECTEDAQSAEASVREFMNESEFTQIHSCCSGKGWMLTKLTGDEIH